MCGKIYLIVCRRYDCVDFYKISSMLLFCSNIAQDDVKLLLFAHMALNIIMDTIISSGIVIETNIALGAIRDTNLTLDTNGY